MQQRQLRDGRAHRGDLPFLELRSGGDLLLLREVERKRGCASGLQSDRRDPDHAFGTQC
jgi:hypothetical protein